jgi:hypothetical protein
MGFILVFHSNRFIGLPAVSVSLKRLLLAAFFGGTAFVENNPSLCRKKLVWGAEMIGYQSKMVQCGYIFNNCMAEICLLRVHQSCHSRNTPTGLCGILSLALSFYGIHIL